MQEARRTHESFDNTLFNDRELISLVIASYKFSRGEADLQELMLQFLASNYGEHINPEKFEELSPRLADAIMKIYLNPKRHPQLMPARVQSRERKAELAEEIRISETNELIRKLSDWALQLREPQNVNIETLSYEIIDRDYYYLPCQEDEKDIRITEKTSNFRTPLNYYSNFVLYGLLRRDTGLGPFNHLFRTCGLAVLGSEQLVNSLCRDVIEGHVEANPEDREELERVLIMADSATL